jgi:AcrR family transcriptional regulator
MATESNPFAITQEERRASLSRHFIPVVEELAADGTPYVDLSVERIIKAGGISRSAFYNYFDDKVDLLVALAGDVILELIKTGSAWWDLPTDADKAALRVALRVPLDYYRSHHTILGAVVEVATYDERVRAQQRSLIDPIAAEMAVHLKRAQQDGTADPELDAERTAKWVVWMFERGLYQLVSPSGPQEAELLLDALTDIVWRVFYAGFREAGQPS